MPNPFNTCIFTGTVVGTPVFQKTKDGKEFCCKFSLGVRRNYKNKGEYKSDYIPVKYEGINRMEFAHNYVKKGARLSLTGSWCTEPFIAKGEKVYSSALLAESIQMAPMNKNETSAILPK